MVKVEIGLTRKAANHFFALIPIHDVASTLLISYLHAYSVFDCCVNIQSLLLKFFHYSLH